MGDSPSGSPALSSAVMPWRASSAETRRARSRSGVTSAAWAPFRSSASRRVRAIAAASVCASGATSSAGPAWPGPIRRAGGIARRAARRPGAAPCPAGPAGGPARRGRRPPPAGSRASAHILALAPAPQQPALAAEGVGRGVGDRVPDLGLGAARSTPCSTTPPWGRSCAITRSNSSAAGMVPPTPMPAAITGSCRRVLLPGAGLRPERLDPAHADIEQPRLGQPALPVPP